MNINTVQITFDTIHTLFMIFTLSEVLKIDWIYQELKAYTIDMGFYH